MNERWRVVQENPYYMVSNLGRVRSLDRKVESRGSARTKPFSRLLKGQIVKPFIVKSTGYLQIRLGKSGRRSVHRIVAMAFCPGYRDGMVVNHKNGKPDDNRAENLEWVTPGENISHAYKVLGHIHNQVGRLGHAHNTSKPVISTCIKTGTEKYYECAHEARHEGFDCGSISRCCHGKIRHHKGRYWRFALPGTHRAVAEGVS